MLDVDFRAFEASVADQIGPPSFEALVANAARRRRNAYAAAATAAAGGAVAVSAVVASVGGPSYRQEPAAPVSSTPSPAPTAEDPTPASPQAARVHVVPDVAGTLDQLNVSVDDPDMHVVVWGVCGAPRCPPAPLVITLSDDALPTAPHGLPSRR
jgi:hypothetical protein